MSEPRRVDLDSLESVLVGRGQGSRPYRWGAWRYKENRTLVHDRASWYEVDLDRCTNSAQVLDWIAQLAHKSWVSPTDLGHFVRALEDLLSLQQAYCGCGVDHQVDPQEVLAGNGYVGPRVPQED